MLQQQVAKEVAGNYRAVEMQLRWLNWLKERRRVFWQATDQIDRPHQSYMNILPSYQQVLETADTFYMNDKFCDLVDHARLSIPDDLEFDSRWIQSRRGWLWLDKPFTVPDISSENIENKVGVGTQQIPKILEGTENIHLKVAAVGWLPIQQGTQTKSGRVPGKGATHFLCFQDWSLYNKRAEGFGCWSYFMLQDGDKLIDRIREFENVALKEGGGYIKDRTADMLHEIRWVYAATYLMAQRLATTVHRESNHAMRKLGKQLKLKVPPIIRTVTLRRFEEERKKHEKTGKEIEWQWQWSVRGHWRNQYFRSTGEHHPVFIESYIKGDPSKPVKPPGHTLFVAKR